MAKEKREIGLVHEHRFQRCTECYVIQVRGKHYVKAIGEYDYMQLNEEDVIANTPNYYDTFRKSLLTNSLRSAYNFREGRYILPKHLPGNTLYHDGEHKEPTTIEEVVAHYKMLLGVDDKDIKVFKCNQYLSYELEEVELCEE